MSSSINSIFENIYLCFIISYYEIQINILECKFPRKRNSHIVLTNKMLRFESTKQDKAFKIKYNEIVQDAVFQYSVKLGSLIARLQSRSKTLFDQSILSINLSQPMMLPMRSLYLLIRPASTGKNHECDTDSDVLDLDDRNNSAFPVLNSFYNNNGSEAILSMKNVPPHKFNHV